LTHLLLVDDEPTCESAVRSALPPESFRVSRVDPGKAAVEALDRDRPNVVLIPVRWLGLMSGAGDGGLLDRSQAIGVPIVALVSDPSDSPALAGPLSLVDDWVAGPALESELSLRVARLLASRGQSARPAEGTLPSLDGQFLALVVHDLRTPLNVIGLSLRMIGQSVPKGDPDLDEDLRFVDENFRQIERMLTQLSDYYRLFENAEPLMPIEFNPRRLVDELLEARATRVNSRSGPVRLEIDGTCPSEVGLDPIWARMALQYALANVCAASAGEPIRLTLRGEGDRWVTEIALDRPPPSSVSSFELAPTSFERLCGSAAERRGMDLSIAAKVTEMFGGRARLRADPGMGTTIVLDWPVRLAGL
jgi:signal transduction histidine kinase